jgi:DnaJ-class molecular chaperone
MAKCKKCKGSGKYPPFKMDANFCPICEGTGVPLVTIVEEQYNEAAELDGTKSHPGDSNYIEFEEDDYEV